MLEASEIGSTARRCSNGQAIGGAPGANWAPGRRRGGPTFFHIVAGWLRVALHTVPLHKPGLRRLAARTQSSGTLLTRDEPISYCMRCATSRLAQRAIVHCSRGRHPRASRAVFRSSARDTPKSRHHSLSRAAPCAPTCPCARNPTSLCTYHGTAVNLLGPALAPPWVAP